MSSAALPMFHTQDEHTALRNSPNGPAPGAGRATRRRSAAEARRPPPDQEASSSTLACHERQVKEDERNLEEARAVNLLLELIVHSFMDDIPDGRLQVPHKASVSFLKRRIEHHSTIEPKFQALKVEASRQEGRLTLQDMPGHEEQGDLCIEEFGLKPPGPRHVWCWVKDPTQPPRDAPEEVRVPGSMRLPGGASPPPAARQLLGTPQSRIGPRQPLASPPALHAAQAHEVPRAPQGGDGQALQSPQSLTAVGPSASPERGLPPAAQALPSPPVAEQGGQPPAKRRKNTAFTEQEVEALIKGVEAYQLSNWASILKYGLTWQPPVFCGRTDVHLKDKWRNMTTAVKKKTTQRGVKLTDEQRERIIKCLPEYNPGINDGSEEEEAADDIETPASVRLT